MAVTDFGGTYRHQDLADLGVGDPHPQYPTLVIGTLAQRPDAAVGREGRLYLATDGQTDSTGGPVPVLQIDAGTTWASAGPGSSPFFQPADLATSPSVYPTGTTLATWAANTPGAPTVGLLGTVTFVRNSTSILQLAYDRDATPDGDERMWWRHGYVGGTPEWGAWQQTVGREATTDYIRGDHKTLGQVQARSATLPAGHGYVQLVPSNSNTRSGYIGFHKHDDVRLGYIGFGAYTTEAGDQAPLEYVAGRHGFVGPQRVTRSVRAGVADLSASTGTGVDLLIDLLMS